MIRVHRSEGRVLVFALAAIAALFVVALVGWQLALRSTAAEMDEKIARAEAEMKRLHYVIKRDAELRDEGASLAQTLEAQPEVPSPARDCGIGETAPPPAPLFLRSEQLEHRKRYLFAVNTAIQQGLHLERGLPALERHVAALEALRVRPAL